MCYCILNVCDFLVLLIIIIYLSIITTHRLIFLIFLRVLSVVRNVGEIIRAILALLKAIDPFSKISILWEINFQSDINTYCTSARMCLRSSEPSLGVGALPAVSREHPWHLSLRFRVSAFYISIRYLLSFNVGWAQCGW